MVQFMSLPTARMPQNALLDLTPLSNAIDSNRKNALLQRESARQDEELAMRKASAGRAEARSAQNDQRAQVEWFGKQAASVDAIQDPGQRAAIWERILQRHPDAANMDPVYRDPTNGPRMVAIEAGQWKPPAAAATDKPKTHTVGGRIVQVNPDGSAREVYAAPEKPDPIKEMLLKRLQGPSGRAPQPQPQSGAPMLQPQSFNAPQSAPNALLMNVDDREATPQAPQPMPEEPLIETPFGAMSREEAQQLGGAMLLDPKYQAAGKAILDSLQGGGSELSKPAATQLDERTISAASTLGRLQTIRQQFKPEFQQIPERLKLLGASWGAKFGGKIPPDMEKQLGDFAAFKATSYDNFNQLLKELSGTAVSAQELARQKIVQPNPGEGLFDGDDPVTFMAKINQGEKIAKAAVARMNFLRSRGVQFNKDTAEQFMRLEDVPAAIDRRGAEIEQELRRANPTADPTSIEREAMNQVKREFGI